MFFFLKDHEKFQNIPEDADDSETEPIETHTFGNCSIADVGGPFFSFTEKKF